MKIFVDKSTISKELKIFQGIFEKKSLMEILQNIKLTAFENGLLELVATDLEIGLKSNIEVDVKEPGTFTVNGKDLYDLVSMMPEGIVEISENNDLQIVITNEKKTCKYKLMGMQSSEYPQLPESGFEDFVKIPIETMASIINTNYYIISPDIKFNLGGALLSMKDGSFEMAATDGNRLAYAGFDNEEFEGRDMEFIVSRKTLMELMKMGSSGEIDFAFDKNNLFFRYNDRVLSSRIIDQKFPNYKAVIPEETKFKAVINKTEFLNCIKRLLIFKTRVNSINFTFKNGLLLLERSTPEKGEAHEELNIQYSGEEFKVCFNGSYIIDFINHVKSDEIEIGIIDSDSSFVFKPVEDYGFRYVYVVMPLNI